MAYERNADAQVEFQIRNAIEYLITGGISIASGLPVLGQDAVGADAHVLVVTAPARACHTVHVAVGDFGAIVSLNAGTDDHFVIPANTERLFPGLSITSGVEIKAKNLIPGSNYSNLAISVW